MRLKKSAFIAGWMLIALNTANGQTGLLLSGKIAGTDGKPLVHASVYLYFVNDSAKRQTGMAGEDGSFVFAGLKTGAYRLSVTMVGYQNYTVDLLNLQKDSILPVIIMQHSAAILKEVAIVAQKPLVEHLIDRTVVNVDAMLSSAGSTAMDALEKSPGVMLDQNSTISLQGKTGVTIYIDDRPTYLSGEDLANYLRSIPSSSIDRIELMSNPPAKYDAAGNAGVINIRLKRTTQRGFNGNMNLALAQGRYARTVNSINANYRHNKWNIGANFGYSKGNSFNTVHINRYFDSTITGISPNFMQRSFTKRQWQNYNLGLNIDYYATPNTTFGIVFTGLLSWRNNNALDTSNLTNAAMQPDSTIIAHNSDSRTFKHAGINGNYRHDFDKKGKSLTIDLDYLLYRSHTSQRFDNNSFFPDGELYYKILQTGDLPADINIWSAKMDYVHPLSNGIKLSGGLKTSLTQTNNIANYFNTLNQVTVADYDETNHFIYRENINAVYVNASRDFSRFSVQAGLRFEQTIANGHQLGNVQKPDSSFSRNYQALFPTFYFQYKIDSAGSQRVSVRYGRRVDRPNYADLNPFLSPLDKFTFNTGNPFLLPSYSDNVQLGYTFKNISVDVYYSYVKDKVDGLVQIINGYYYSEPGNIGHTYTKGIELDGSMDITKWFNLNLYARLFSQHTVTDFFSAPLDTKGVGFFIHPVLTFKPGRNWTIQTDGSYRARLVTEQFIDAERKGVNAAVSKKLSASVTLKLVANDLFNSFDNRWQIGHLAGTKADYRNVSDTRNVVFSFTWRFGTAIKDQRRHDANGAQSEMNRINN